jgi:hypothetical protein
MRTRLSFHHVRGITNRRDVGTRNTTVWLASLLILAGSAQLARATGPDYQVVPNAVTASTPASSVVDFLRGSTDTTDNGTGDIFTKFASNGVDYADVITADHVGSDSTAGGYNAWVGIGVNNDTAPTAGGATPSLFKETLLAAGGPNAGVNFEDLDIVQIALGAATNANAIALFNSIVPVNISSPIINGFGTTGGTNATFTEYGYGYAGKPIVQAGTPGYGAYDRPFNSRFQNNKLTFVNTNYANTFKATTGINNGNFYVEPTAHFNTIAPTNSLLQGTSFPGDSGGPYDYLASQQLSVSNYYSGQLITNSVFTDYEFAVHVAGGATGANTFLTNYDGTTITTNAAKLNGNDNYGVYIDQANYNWIESFVVVPEPSSGLLVLVGGSFLAGFVRRSNRRKSGR